MTALLATAVWQKDGACNEAPAEHKALFFPDTGNGNESARMGRLARTLYCEGCLVRTQCLQQVLESEPAPGESCLQDEGHEVRLVGVWGGFLFSGAHHARARQLEKARAWLAASEASAEIPG